MRLAGRRTRAGAPLRRGPARLALSSSLAIDCRAGGALLGAALAGRAAAIAGQRRLRGAHRVQNAKKGFR